MNYTFKALLILWAFLCFSPARGNPETSPHNYAPAKETNVNAPPAAGFTFTTNGGCVPVVVQFYSHLKGPSYNWNFGDGGTSTDCNPVHVYTIPGTYVVVHNATGGSYMDTIIVGDTPVVNFTGADFSCLGDTKPYSITSTIPPASYLWSAQGGTVVSSTSTTVNVQWNTYGIGYINYTITTAQGCTKIFRFAVKVIPPPTVNLPCCEKRQTGEPGKPGQGHEQVPGGSEPCEVCAGSYSCYQGAVQPDFGLASDYTWTWTVTNGVIDTLYPDSTQVCVVWGASGTGTIKLVLTHKIYGCTTIKECEVNIKPGITPVFTISGACLSWPVNFDASGTTPIADVTDFFWEYGDGYSEHTAGPGASHKYDFTGTYTATLTITTKENCTYKISHTFNVISGTRPIIACPGTICKGSRACYSTTFIAGASYVWNIVGDDPLQQIISANGNEICVTWGNGPVGTVTVTVNNGGYTCTNTSTEVISIVDNVIPVAGPDFICQQYTGIVEVSTANYTGACYRWFVDGVLQPSAITNELQFFVTNGTAPIKIDVQVDFGLGCCRGTGQRIIKRLPRYDMNIYQPNVCIGTTQTYTLFFPAGAPSLPVSWDVEGGTIGPSSPTSVTVTWNTPGVGTITAGNNTPNEYCNDASNNTWNVTVWDKAKGDDIAGEQLVCANGTPHTYYHAFENPTASAVVTCPGATVVQGTYSSTIAFSAPGTYTVTVTYIHAVVPPCPTVKTYTVTAVSPINPVFTIPPGNVCEGDIKTYTAVMTDPNLYDLSVIGGSIVSQTFALGTLTLQIQWNSTVTSSISLTNKACGNTSTQNITVHGRPVVIITPGPISCGSGSRTLNVAPIWNTYTWSAGVTPGVPGVGTITTPGTYSVTVTNNFCPNTGSVTVTVVSPTAPDLTGFTPTPPPSNVCPKYYTICPTITPGSGSITSYAWTFTGFNITSASVPCPSVALPTSPGLHTGTWKLVITDSYGCKDSMTGSYTDSCSAGSTTGTGTPCTSTAMFNISYDPCTGIFSPIAPSANYTAVFWDFGDNTTGSGFSPTHFYTTCGPKTVICYVADNGTPNACWAAFSFTINVPYVFVNPQVTVANSACNGASSITASGLSICGSLTPSYSWTVVGATTYTAVTSTPTLNVGLIPGISNGNNSVTVVMTVAGCSRTITGSFVKGGLQAYFVSCNGCAGSPITFIDQSTPFNAPIIQWTWTITGPASLSSELQNPTITFPTSGTYSIKLKVVDNILCSDSDSISIIIAPAPVLTNIKVNGVPKPDGTIVDVCPGTVTTLEAPSAGVGTTWLWSDGNTSQVRPATAQGDYYVTVFTGSNCAKKIGPIKLRYKPAPQAIIQASVSACSPRLLTALKGTGWTYAWTYPAGSYLGGPASLFLTSSGPVTLTVTNLYGCTATVTQNFTVNPTPSANITYAPQPFCPGSIVTLTGNPSGGTAPYSHLWNNGANTVSITNISTPGVYRYKVTDANGCNYTAQLNLQPVVPNMDKLPYGCYDVCGPVSFCTGTMPFGWTGQWYNGASPYGGVIPQGGNIATTFSSPGTYTLHYTPVDATTHCAAISRPITINFITLPTFTVTGSVDPLVICKGSGQGIVLTANPQIALYAYNWYLNGALVGTGYTYTATIAGVYTLEVVKNPCCKKVVDVIVTEGDCCFENAGVPFTPILSTRWVTSNEFWFDKYYVDAQIIVDNAELDITNVDMVFGPNGEIIVQNGGFLRCNNSVLRPCKKDDIWKGVTFQGDNTSGWINTTTIKNAIIAVQIIGNSKGVRLTDNSIIKCQTGVWIRDSREQSSISGNTFETDDTPLNYPFPSNEYYAIRLDNSDMRGLISQNDFRHVNPQKAGNIYYGIYTRVSDYTASENRFNDMYRAVDIAGNSEVIALEKNEFKVNTLKQTTSLYQVRISDCQRPVLIYENTMDNSLGENSAVTGLYVAKTYRTHIKDNKFNGFWESVVSVSNSDIYITSNEITSQRSIGINLWDTRRSIVSCNTIKAMVSNATLFGGNPLFGIVDDEGSDNNEYANCIFDQHTSIYLHSSSGVNLPGLVNNYMYNYRDNGIYNDGYNGSIGNPGGPLPAGRNTFMSNNGAAGSTFDINSTNFIFEGGNFGIQMTNNVGSTTGTDEFYSTASCGQQIQQTYRQNQQDKYNICDVYNLEEWIWRDSDGKFHLVQPPSEVTTGIINEQLKAGKVTIFGQISAQMLKDNESAKRAADAVLQSDMNKNEAATLIVDNCIAINDAQLAVSMLVSPQLSTIDADLRKVLETEIAIVGKKSLNGQQVSNMTVVDNKNNAFSPLARDIIQSWNGEHDYKFKTFQQPQLKKADNPLVRLNNSLKVYPVPSYDEITVKHFVLDAKVQRVKIISPIGAEIANFTYTLQAGEIVIDISQLAAGVYTVMLVTDSEDKTPMSGRFIKLQ